MRASLIAAAVLLLSQPLIAGGDVVAVVNGLPITTAEIEPLVSAQLLQIRQRDYDIKAKAIREIAFDRLKAAESSRRGITPEELYRLEVIEKAGAVPEKEIETLLRVLASRLPKDPLEARAAAVESLRNQRIGLRAVEFQSELMARFPYELRIQPPRSNIRIGTTAPTRGGANAAVTVVEFSDFQCPYCIRSQEVLKRLEEHYGGQVRLVFKHFPLETIHRQARLAAEASACASEQNRFWELHDWMFENAATLSRDDILAGAKGLKIDTTALAKCIDEGREAGVVDADVQLGKEIGVQGTPAFFVNGRLLSQGTTFEAFRDLIDEELKALAK